jgi:hypothetical protein
MQTESKLRLADVFVSITDPRQPGKVEHDLVEVLEKQVLRFRFLLVPSSAFVRQFLPRFWKFPRTHFLVDGIKFLAVDSKETQIAIKRNG